MPIRVAAAQCGLPPNTFRRRVTKERQRREEQAPSQSIACIDRSSIYSLKT